MKVLVIKLGALGDVIMATSLLQAIARHHESDELCLLTVPAFAGLFTDWPRLAVKTFDRGSLRALLATAWWVRQQGFARVYDLQSNDRSAILCALSGIPLRIGNHPRYPYNCHPPGPWRGQSHIFERMNEVLAAAGVPAAEPRPHLPIDAAGAVQVSRWLNEHGLAAGGFAILHAGASPRWESKRWPHFGELARLLEQHGRRVVWAGAEPDAERNAALARIAGIDATGAFSIAGLAELGRHAAFAVTNDSGPMHALSAAGIPVYALFGPSDWRRNHALGQTDRVIAAAEDCPGCVQGATALAAHRCLAAIPAVQVFERLQRDGLI